tara:strand:- start:465 stop:761 length:297 start_codon:yes stop_codon:yes gene_type:complete
MTDDDALKLALEALKNNKKVREGEGGTMVQPILEDAAILAIEEALAQPEQEPLNGARINYFYQSLANSETAKQFNSQNWFQAGFAISEAAHGIKEKNT